MFREQYNNYQITDAEIMAEYCDNSKSYFDTIMKEGRYKEERAELIIAKFSQQQIKQEIPPIIKAGITKLSIIHFLAKMDKVSNIDDLVALEKIENNSIKALMYSNSLWGDIVNEEASEVTIMWFLIVEEALLEDKLAMSNALKDKVLLRDRVDDVKIYHNWDAHVIVCSEIRVDPKLYSEEEALDMRATLDSYHDMMGGV